jgi:hypothetical protein
MFEQICQHFLDYIINHAPQEWAMIRGAPITLFVIVVMVIGVVAYLYKRTYSRQLADRDTAIERLRTTMADAISGKDASIEALKHWNELVSAQLENVLEQTRQRPQISAEQPPERIIASANTEIARLSAEITRIKTELTGGVVISRKNNNIVSFEGCLRLCPAYSSSRRALRPKQKS